MTVVRSAAVTAVLALGACRGGEPTPQPTADPVAVEAGTGAVAVAGTGAAEATGEGTGASAVAVREIANLQFSAPLDAIAVDGSGNLATFVEDGTVVLSGLKTDRSGYAELARTALGGRAVDAGWIGRELIVLDIARDSVVRYGSVAEGFGEPSVTELGGDPRDLWIDTAHRRLWVLLNVETGGQLVVLDVPEWPAPVVEAARFDVGVSPVAIFPAPEGDRLAVPAFRAEQVTTFNVEPPALEHTQTVPFRPALLTWPAVDRVLVAAANLTDAELIELPSGARSTVALPSALNVVARGEGGVYGFSPSQAVLYRLDRASFAVLGETSTLTMVTVLDATMAILAAVDTQTLGRIVLLDALSLETLASWPLTGHPSRVVSVDDMLFALCPNDRRVVALRVVDGRSAAP